MSSEENSDENINEQMKEMMMCEAFENSFPMTKRDKKRKNIFESLKQKSKFPHLQQIENYNETLKNINLNLEVGVSLSKQLLVQQREMNEKIQEKCNYLAQASKSAQLKSAGRKIQAIEGNLSLAFKLQQNDIQSSSFQNLFLKESSDSSLDEANSEDPLSEIAFKNFLNKHNLTFMKNAKSKKISKPDFKLKPTPSYSSCLLPAMLGSSSSDQIKSISDKVKGYLSNSNSISSLPLDALPNFALPPTSKHCPSVITNDWSSPSTSSSFQNPGGSSSELLKFVLEDCEVPPIHYNSSFKNHNYFKALHDEIPEEEFIANTLAFRKRKHVTVSDRKKIINKFPTRIVSLPNNKHNKDCYICHAEFVNDDILRTLPCSHEFHTMCLDPWLKLELTCPVCRVDAS